MTVEKNIILTEQELSQRLKKEFCGTVDNLEVKRTSNNENRQL